MRAANNASTWVAAALWVLAKRVGIVFLVGLAVGVVVTRSFGAPADSQPCMTDQQIADYLRAAEYNAEPEPISHDEE